MNERQANRLWARLASEGKAPTELNSASLVLPSYTAGIRPWIDRLSARYLQGDRGLCKHGSHFKLVLAPYGGGKTHFLLALGLRAREEGYAVSFISCSRDLSLDKPLDVYREVVKRLQLPGDERSGMRAVLDATFTSKRREIRERAPDVDAAMTRWITTIRRDDYPAEAFGRVMAEALKGQYDESDLGEAATRWLQGDPDTLSRSEMLDLRLAKVPSDLHKRFGLDLLLSMVRFLPETGVHGLVLLMDEVETMFNTKGKALLRVLAAMRVLVDMPDSLPLLGVFSATPDMLEEFPKYPAIEQRLGVAGVGFEQGGDLSPQLWLDRVQSQEKLLTEIGQKLITVGETARDYSFDHELQCGNAARLARVASARNLDVDARRIFVKTWVSLLDIQVGGEREFGHDELAGRYQGSFDSVHESDESDSETYEP